MIAVVTAAVDDETAELIALRGSPETKALSWGTLGADQGFDSFPGLDRTPVGLSREEPR